MMNTFQSAVHTLVHTIANDHNVAMSLADDICVTYTWILCDLSLTHNSLITFTPEEVAAACRLLLTKCRRYDYRQDCHQPWGEVDPYNFLPTDTALPSEKYLLQLHIRLHRALFTVNPGHVDCIYDTPIGILWLTEFITERLSDHQDLCREAMCTPQDVDTCICAILDRTSFSQWLDGLEHDSAGPDEVYSIIVLNAKKFVSALPSLLLPMLDILHDYRPIHATLLSPCLDTKPDTVRSPRTSRVELKYSPDNKGWTIRSPVDSIELSTERFHAEDHDSQVQIITTSYVAVSSLYARHLQDDYDDLGLISGRAIPADYLRTIDLATSFTRSTRVQLGHIHDKSNHQRTLQRHQLLAFESEWIYPPSRYLEKCHLALSTSPSGSKKTLQHRIRTALQLWQNAIFVQHDAPAIAMLTASLEALLGSRDTAIADKLATRCASMLEPDREHRVSLYRLVKTVYNQRSRILHGDAADGDKRTCRKLELLVAAVLCAYFELQDYWSRSIITVPTPDAFLKEVEECHTSGRPVLGISDSIVASLWRTDSEL